MFGVALAGLITGFALKWLVEGIGGYRAKGPAAQEPDVSVRKIRYGGVLSVLGLWTILGMFSESGLVSEPITLIASFVLVAILLAMWVGTRPK